MSAASPEPTSGFNTTVGAYLIAIMFMYMLCGTSIAQVVHYFRRYQDDRAMFKYMVFAVFCLQFTYIFMITHATYTDVVFRRVNPALIVKPTWSVALQPVFGGLVIIIVRIFFSFRIWQLSGSAYFPAFIISVAMGPLGISIYLSVLIMAIPSWADLIHESWPIWLIFSLDVFIDATITVLMVSWLREKQAMQNTVPSTSSVLGILMAYNFSTGALQVVFYSACLVLFGFMPDNFIWQGVYGVIPQVLITSMLGALNARKRLRSKHATERDAQFGLQPQASGIRLEIHELVEVR